MNATNSEVRDVLGDLIQICKDGQEGFQNAAEHMEASDVKSLLAAYSLQRSEFAGALQAEAHGLGEHDPKNSGSVSAGLHRGWFNLKAAIAGNDLHAILAECERGEDAAVAAYKKALMKGELPADIRRVIERQFVEVLAAHDAVKALRDAAVKQ
jgi:uncharacterized protein (TIGR02284 family)